MTIISIIESIPDVVWGAGLGSFITLFGVWLTNRHERGLRDEEREYSTKIDIYLKAAEEIAHKKILLGKIPSMEPSKIEMELTAGVEAAKVYVVGDTETLKSVTSLYTFLTKKMMEILIEAMPLYGIRADIGFLTEFIEADTQKLNKTLNEMTAFNLRGDSDQEFWGRLQKNFEHQSIQMNESVEKRDKANDKLLKLQKELSLKCLGILAQMSNYEVEAIRCIRKELGLEFDAEDYSKVINDRDIEIVSDATSAIGKIIK